MAASPKNPLMMVVNLFSSLKFAMVLLALLGVLTWAGTLEQVNLGLYDVQKKYFESLFLVHHFGPVPVPLPGGYLLMGLLSANMLVGGILRLRHGWRTAGVLVTHLGMALLIVAGLVKAMYAEDGHVTLFEGQEAAHFTSYYLSELAVSRVVEEGAVEEFTIPTKAFDRATGDEPVVLRDERLPFDIEVRWFASNAAPRRKGPMFEVPQPVIDNVYLQGLPRAKEAEQNLPGAHLTAVDRASGERTAGLAWAFDLGGMESGPFTVEAAGGPWAIDLRKKHYPMPFAVRLDDFQKKDHPRTNMPAWFSSDVTLSEAGAERSVQISMNKPLRDAGLVLFQASWGPKDAGPGTDLFSTFAVVRNPSDHWPIAACTIVGLGMLLHFGRKLLGHIKSETRRA